jgi:hypothetical protein
VGDVGVGKTRFVTEALQLPAAQRPVSAWGACLPLTEKLPFLPVSEVLDALDRLDGSALLARAVASIPQYAQVETARPLPQLQSADASAGSSS